LILYLTKYVILGGLYSLTDVGSAHGKNILVHLLTVRLP